MQAAELQQPSGQTVSLAPVALGSADREGLPVVQTTGYPSFSGDPGGGGASASGGAASSASTSSASASFDTSADDGTKSPAAVVAGAFLAHLQHYSSLLRPWSSFLVIKRPDTTSESLRAHAEKNLGHFQANYLFIIVGYLLLVMLNIGEANHIFAVLIIVALWAAYARRGGFEPEWTPTIFGMECASQQRLLAMVAASALILVTALGPALLSGLIGLPAVAILGHAILHPGATAIGDYTTLSNQEFGLA